MIVGIYLDDGVQFVYFHPIEPYMPIVLRQEKALKEKRKVTDEMILISMRVTLLGENLDQVHH